MYLVFTKSTGLATAAAVNPAMMAEEKWQRTPSAMMPVVRMASLATSYTTISHTFTIPFLAMLGPRALTKRDDVSLSCAF